MVALRGTKTFGVFLQLFEPDWPPEFPTAADQYGAGLFFSFVVRMELLFGNPRLSAKTTPNGTGRAGQNFLYLKRALDSFHWRRHVNEDQIPRTNFRVQPPQLHYLRASENEFRESESNREKESVIGHYYQVCFPAV